MHPRHRWLRIRQYVIPILATVLAVFIVGAILVVQSHLKKSRQAKLELGRVIFDKSSISNLDEKEFNALLARNNSDQLTRLALDLADEPNQVLAVRLDRMKKRLAVLNRILELDPNEQVRNFAVSTKLATLMDREFVAVKNDLDDDLSPTQLREFAGKHAQSDNVASANAASAAVAVAAISEFLGADTSRRRDELAKPAIDELRIAAGNTVNDLSVAKRFENWLKMIQSNSDAGHSQMFVDAFVECYRRSTNDTIAGMAARIRKSIGDSELELVELIGSRPENRNETISQLKSQVDAVLNQGDVSESRQLFILSRADDLLRIGRKSDAQEIRQKIRGLSKVDGSDELNRELAKFDQRVKLFETPIDVSCFTDLNSNPAKFNTADAAGKILYFGSATNNEQPFVEFKQLLNALRGELANSILELAVVYLDRGTDSKALNNVRTFANQKGRWQVWFLTTTSSEGQELLARMPIDTTPYVVVLGKDNRVIALDPPIVDIKEIVLKK